MSYQLTMLIECDELDCSKITETTLELNEKVMLAKINEIVKSLAKEWNVPKSTIEVSYLSVVEYSIKKNPFYFEDLDWHNIFSIQDVISLVELFEEYGLIIIEILECEELYHLDMEDIEDLITHSYIYTCREDFLKDHVGLDNMIIKNLYVDNYVKEYIAVNDLLEIIAEDKYYYLNIESV